MLFKIQYDFVKVEDYKFKIVVIRPLLMTRKHLEKKLRRVLNLFPNYSAYWDSDFDFIINLYFDSTGWDKDRENRKLSTYVGDGFIQFKWTED